VCLSFSHSRFHPLLSLSLSLALSLFFSYVTGGHVSTLAVLIHMDASILTASDVYGQIPLHLAAHTGRYCLHSCVLYRCMCVCGVWYVSANDVYGQILLHFAAHMGRYCFHSYVLYRMYYTDIVYVWCMICESEPCVNKFSCILLHTRAGTI